MKIQRSAILSLLALLALAGCGSEQFGTTPQSTKSTADPLISYQQLSCSSSTLIKPKVDILYVVDNSGSSFYIPDEIKTAVANTVSSVSQQFDYRIIGLPLIPGTQIDYQVLTNSTDSLPDSSKKIISTSQLSFFSNPGQQYTSEKGLARTIDFINSSGSLFRNNAHLLIVMVSNGRDVEVELDPNGTGATVQNTSLFSSRLASLNAIKSNKNLQQLEFYSATAKSERCGGSKPEWRRSTESYVAMANALGSTSYDLCTQSISDIFVNVNSTIKQEIVPHLYRYFPMTFAKDSDTRNTFGEIEVYKVSQNNAPVKLTSGWSYHYSNNGFEDTKELPLPAGERVYGRHFIRFDSLVSYPDCIQIKSVTKTEYFKYIVIPKEPKTSPAITVFINGVQIPQSSTNGWSYRGNISVPNIKAAYPNAGDELPAVPKSGFMIELNGSGNYYKSGDSVQVNYVPAGV